MIDKRADAAAAYAKAPKAPESADVESAAGDGVQTESESEVGVDPRPQDSGFTEESQATDDEGAEQVEIDLDELASRAQKADEYLVLAQRTQADFENFRKRAARDAAVAQERGVAKLAKELLPAIDNLDRAIAAHREAAEGSEASQIVDGIRLVQVDLLSALARAGIEPFSPAGEPFNPQFHEAVAQNQVDGVAAGTVIDVYQQGYRHGETVLRPARVLVAA